MNKKYNNERILEIVIFFVNKISEKCLKHLMTCVILH